jgi:signal transduction histidine kinase
MILNPLLEDIYTFAQSKEVACSIKCPPDLYVLGESDRLAECFDELTSNSIYWLNKSDKFIDIEVINPAPFPLPKDLDPEKQYALIHFRDNGPGVQPTHKNKIFELFYSNRDHGTGIGLALIRRIIEGHGGAIFETGTLGQGVDFEIYLPLAHSLNETYEYSI